LYETHKRKVSTAVKVTLNEYIEVV